MKTEPKFIRDAVQGLGLRSNLWTKAARPVFEPAERKELIAQLYKTIEFAARFTDNRSTQQATENDSTFESPYAGYGRPAWPGDIPPQDGGLL